MRLLFLVPDLVTGLSFDVHRFLQRQHARVERLPLLRRALVHPYLHVRTAFGGTLNLMRHAQIARSMGAEALLATPRGKDTYGRFNVVELPFVRWSERRSDDVCVIPEFCSALVNDVRGKAIVYLQVPLHLYRDFDYTDPRVQLWTDSPFMLEKSRSVFPGKEIPIVPNVVDGETFAFRPQAEREPGLIFAFPRKGPEYIEATEQAYRKRGGSYWRFERIDGLSLHELARQMRRPQAFLASGDVEGCALPPQESMAAGIVVVGKSARGANFSMEHRRTAMIAETPEQAAQSLVELEDAKLREDISRAGHAFISRYFPSGEPKSFWRKTLRDLGFPIRATTAQEEELPVT